MKTIFNLRKSIFFVAALFAVVSMTSCGDDNNEPKIPAVTDVYGTYQGKMYVVSPVNHALAEEESGESVDINAEVKSDTVYIESFPVDMIVAAIEGEESAATIIEALGKVPFKVGYTGQLNTAQDSIQLTLDPKPLEFAYTTGEGEEAATKTVKVTVTTQENTKSAYAESESRLKFYLSATEVLVNEEALSPFSPLFYSFDLSKK